MVNLSRRSCVLRDRGWDLTIYVEIVTELTITKEAEISSSPIDAGMGARNPIDWHMSVNKPEFELKVAFYGDDDHTYRELFYDLFVLMHGKRLVNFTNEFGSFDNCVVQEMGGTAGADSYTSWDGTVRIKQLTVISAGATYFHAIYDKDGKPVAGQPSNSGGLSITLSRPISIEKEDEEEGGFWDKQYKHLEDAVTDRPPIIVGI